MLWQEKQLLMYKSLRSFVLCRVISSLQKLGLATAVQMEIEVETGQSCASSSSFQTCQRNADYHLLKAEMVKQMKRQECILGITSLVKDNQMWMQMWHLGMWFNGEHSSTGLKPGLDDLTGLFQPERFYDPTAEGEASSARVWRKGREEDPSQQRFPREQHAFWFWLSSGINSDQAKAKGQSFQANLRHLWLTLLPCLTTTPF